MREKTRPLHAPFFMPFHIKEQTDLYCELSKSGIVLLVLFATACGYIIGINHETAFDISHFLSILIGVGLLAASSCALNQIQERNQDGLMKRTQHRPLPSGRITLPHALFFCLITGSIGLSLLYHKCIDAFFIGLLSFFLYNGLYTLWWKPTLAYAAIPGAIPGALPIYIGFVSSSHALFSTQGIYLFCILFFWQMPHFWALALKYEKDYAKAGFPILPVVKGQSATLRSITLWCLGYISLMHISLIFFKLSTLSILLIACINALLIKALFSFRRHPSQWLQFFLWVNMSLICFLFILAVDGLKHQILRYILYWRW